MIVEVQRAISRVLHRGQVEHQSLSYRGLEKGTIPESNNKAFSTVLRHFTEHDVGAFQCEMMFEPLVYPRSFCAVFYCYTRIGAF